MKTIRLIELFAGYGSQALALKRLNIPFEHYRVVEFDKYAIKSYNALHGTDFKPLDIKDVTAEDLGLVEDDNYNYLMTYSFPCTDLSKAGKKQGMSKDSGTRSGLLWEVERILKEAQQKMRLPHFLLMENVIQAHGEQNIKDFGEWITFLDSLGYISKWQDLNAKDYGIPQNRERCFMVSYLDKSLKFAFPSPVELTKKAKDYLEDSVADRYYLNQERADRLLDTLIEGCNSDYIKIRANSGQGFYNLSFDGVCDLSYPKSTTKRARVINNGDICPTISTCYRLDKIEKQGNLLRIRKLTPLECFRFMDVTDEEAKKMLAVNSEAQCYKQAGNSIVVSVMVAIFNNLLLGGSEKEKRQLDIFDVI